MYFVTSNSNAIFSAYFFVMYCYRLLYEVSFHSDGDKYYGDVKRDILYKLEIINPRD